jgi:hypothetical protein
MIKKPVKRVTKKSTKLRIRNPIRKRNPIPNLIKLNETNLKKYGFELLGNNNEFILDDLIDFYKKNKSNISTGKYSSLILQGFDKILGNYGVESIAKNKQLRETKGSVIYYSNSGETYSPTIIWWKDSYWIGNWGFIIEEGHRN